MASEANLTSLKAGGRREVIGAVRSGLRRFEQQIVEKKDWRAIREDIEVEHWPSDSGDKAYILYRSEARKAKDAAINARTGGISRTTGDSADPRGEASAFGGLRGVQERPCEAVESGRAPKFSPSVRRGSRRPARTRG